MGMNMRKGIAITNSVLPVSDEDIIKAKNSLLQEEMAMVQ
jgi:hypothetical protein